MKNYVQAFSKRNEAHLKSSSQLNIWVGVQRHQRPHIVLEHYLAQIGLGDELVVISAVSSDDLVSLMCIQQHII